MNEIILKGLIRNIKTSHVIDGTEYCKSDLIVKNNYTGNDDVISLKFKRFSNRYKENDIAEIYGNIRSYSQRNNDGTNHVSIYVFTYQDLIQGDLQDNNFARIDGRICKIEPLRTTKSGKQNIHFTIANNIISDKTGQKVNSYIPCTAWGKLALSLSQLSINDFIEITGELHSREYKKQLPNNEIEIKVAHELVVKSYNLIKDN